MNNFWFIVFSVFIAAMIGGITNHLAIKMLFHPRRPWFVGGRKVPFTPGLIPKRKEEIAYSLGRVVGEHLVTPQGLIGMLRKPDFIHKIEGKLHQAVLQWTSSEMTLEQLSLKFFTAEQFETYKKQWIGWVSSLSERGITHLWREQGFSKMKLTELIPDWSEEKKQELFESAADVLLRELKQEMLSPDGERLLRQMSRGLLGQSGGILGTLAGLFMDEDKWVKKIQASMLPQFESAALKRAVISMMYRKAKSLEELNLEQCVDWITKQDSLAWLLGRSHKLLAWESWLNQLGDIPLSQLLGEYQEWLLGRIPSAVHTLLVVLENNMERLIEAVELPRLVEEQVEKFPVEQLERILLSVSGKEFRAITWLGALLGGMIGLFQAFFLIWYR